MEQLVKYFPRLNARQVDQFKQLGPLYADWNQRINLISRKDMDSFYERHVLHSLAIAKVHAFKNGHRVMDLGTGGGFPGIPLAILFPSTKFVLVDSILKKITVVDQIIGELGLKNARALCMRAEETDTKFECVVTRAVAATPMLLSWTRGVSRHLLALKGGDLEAEIKEVGKRSKVTVHPIAGMFDEPFFETKAVVEVWT